ncbi:hypothetical protein KFK09_006127 [Dendrobium nobile]|uniref:Uncharacterized protein n=1 Tax=Dendrobium nobile TaxID=94219 RepID=A0A8T3BSS3_DENNO|nr:hypothetical protein KFK09_006127 [Dendrobium nobile]
MLRKVARKLANSPGICQKLLHFFTKHLSYSVSKTVMLGSRKPEDYEISIEYVEREHQKAEDKLNIQEKMKIERKMSEAKGGEKVKDEKAMMRKKKPSIDKKEKVRLESNIDERSGKFIEKKRRELFAA